MYASFKPLKTIGHHKKYYLFDQLCYNLSGMWFFLWSEDFLFFDIFDPVQKYAL